MTPSDPEWRVRTESLAGFLRRPVKARGDPELGRSLIPDGFELFRALLGRAAAPGRIALDSVSGYPTAYA